ncbi:response regulator [Cohnella fermenti]|uniref:Response regulator n=1 Tax=Cohnella fermenti TaxID=2565925 RepID=A0A4S4BJK8_9BACL|nr:response regulator [Cohnella fermenti]THF74837.1 response regulator [Cohnella fermenti]
MYRLLIVDNETYVVDGLVEYLSTQELDLEVLGVYSAAEALAWLNRAKIDILLSDIRMPAMDGLQLQQETMRRWPRCKVIFLSGYNDFAYVQEAMRQGSVDYILKTEGDDAIVAAIRQALARIEDEMAADSLLSGAKKRMKNALTLMQKDYMLRLLSGDRAALRSVTRQFAELELPLDPNLPVLPALVKIDEWDRQLGPSDRHLLQYAVQNVAEEYLRMSTVPFSFTYDWSRIVWLLQPNGLHSLDLSAPDSDAWKLTSRFAHGMFECIQSTCKELLKLSVSIAVSAKPVTWSGLESQFERLRTRLGRNIGSKQQLVLDEGSDEGAAAALPDYGSLLRKCELLEYYLENDLRDEFMQMTAALLRSAGEDLPAERMYYSLVPIFLGALGAERVRPEAESRADLSLLTRLDLHRDWSAASEYLLELAEAIFDVRVKEPDNERTELIRRIHAYIGLHLAEDLSLTRIADVVGHSPGYLSRLYKSQTGQGLSEHVSESRLNRTKELLAQRHYRIPDIMKATGFVSEHYFYRFFKKATRMTPLEYRNRALEGKGEPPIA